MTTILGGDQTPNPATTEALQTLVGDGKKFKDIEALARGKLEADAFIQKLQEENQRMRESLEKSMNLDEQLAALARGAAPDNSGTPPLGNSNQPAAPSLKPEDVEALLDKTLSAREQKQREQENLRQVNDFLLKHFGDENKAKDAVAALNSSLGVNLTELAAKSPAAVQRLIVGQTGSGLPAERGTVITGMSQGEVRNHAYYEAKRKEMGNARFYSDRRMQVQLHKDAQALGDAFYK